MPGVERVPAIDVGTFEPLPIERHSAALAGRGANLPVCHPRACPEDPSCCKLGLSFFGTTAMHLYWVYILASRPYGTLYIGVTNNLIFRVEMHRAGEGSKFTAKHGVDKLVCYEEFAYVEDALQREKSLKRYRRQWKINLIEQGNPHWIDLYPQLANLPANRAVRASGEMGPRDKPEDDKG